MQGELFHIKGGSQIFAEGDKVSGLYFLQEGFAVSRSTLRDEDLLLAHGALLENYRFTEPHRHECSVEALTDIRIVYFAASAVGSGMSALLSEFSREVEIAAVSEKFVLSAEHTVMGLETLFSALKIINWMSEGIPRQSLSLNNVRAEMDKLTLAENDVIDKIVGELSRRKVLNKISVNNIVVTDHSLLNKVILYIKYLNVAGMEFPWSFSDLQRKVWKAGKLLSGSLGHKLTVKALVQTVSGLFAAEADTIKGILKVWEMKGMAEVQEGTSGETVSFIISDERFAVLADEEKPLRDLVAAVLLRSASEGF